MLNQGINPNEDFHGNTPLIFAIQNEKIEIVKLLIKRGANVNQISKGSKTPLMETLNYSAQGPREIDRLQIINILLGAGADPNKRISEQAETPMTRALLQKQVLLVKRLKEFM